MIYLFAKLSIRQGNDGLNDDIDGYCSACFREDAPLCLTGTDNKLEK